jgi:hypothetical protein
VPKITLEEAEDKGIWEEDHFLGQWPVRVEALAVL